MIDPAAEFAGRINDLRRQVEELQRAASRYSGAGGAVGVTKGTATTATSASTTETALTVTSGDPPSITATLAAGRRYRASFQGRFISTVAADIVLVRILDGATQLSGALYILSSAQAVTAQVDHVIDGDGASHTLSVKFARQGGTGTVSPFCSSTTPLLFVVEDIGPA